MFSFWFGIGTVLSLENIHGREKFSYVPNRLLIFMGEEVLCTPGVLKIVQENP